MPSYILLGKFTEQGARHIKDTTKRLEGIRTLAKGLNITVKDAYWTQGAFDTALVVEAPDEAAMTAFTLSIAAQGNVHTQTLRAFTSDEITSILSKVS